MNRLCAVCLCLFWIVLTGCEQEDTTPPAPPRGLEAKWIDNGEALLLTWQPNHEPDLAGYRVVANEPVSADPYNWQGGFLYSSLIPPSPNPSHIDNSWHISGIWTYYVFAVDHAGNESDWSNPVKVFIPEEKITHDVGIPLPVGD